MKKLLSALLLIFWISAVCIALMLVFKKEGESDERKIILLEIWQLDMVEGGKGSRKQYLLNIAKEFEKKEDGILLSVVNQSALSAEENFAKGVYPDMISYSQGLSGVSALCQPIEENKNIYGGSYKNQTLALPWAIGGYVYVKRAATTCVKNQYLSKTPYTLPIIAMILEGLDLTGIVQLEQENAYYAFLNDSDSALIGTQRDLYRLQNKDMNLDITPLISYTDIVQYISILTRDEKRLMLCKKFLSFLSDSSRKDVCLLGMLSPRKDANIGDNGPIALFYEKNFKYTLPFFYSKDYINTINDYLIDEKIQSDKKMKYLKSAVICLK